MATLTKLMCWACVMWTMKYDTDPGVRVWRVHDIEPQKCERCEKTDILWVGESK